MSAPAAAPEPRFACHGCTWTGDRATEATAHATRAGVPHVTYYRDTTTGATQ